MPNPENIPTTKLSATGFSAFLGFPKESVTFTDCPRTGDTIFHNAILMAEGTWTDSLNKKPLKYTAKQIASMRFEKMAFKAQHDIYGELPLTNEIGKVENARLNLNPAKWVGDVRIFPTALGKDIATLIKRKQITDISPEFFFDGIEDGEPNGIAFMGAVTVRTGACRVCTFNEGIDPNLDVKIETTNIGIDSMIDPEIKPAVSPGGTVAELKSGKETDISKLEAQLADARKLKVQDVEVLGAQLEEVKKARENQANIQIESLTRKVAELESQNKALIQKIVEDEHSIKVKSLERQIAELAKEPMIYTKASPSATLENYRAATIDSDPDFAYVSAQDME